MDLVFEIYDNFFIKSNCYDIDFKDLINDLQIIYFIIVFILIKKNNINYITVPITKIKVCIYTCKYTVACSRYQVHKVESNGDFFITFATAHN